MIYLGLILKFLLCFLGCIVSGVILLAGIGGLIVACKSDINKKRFNG